MNFSRLLAVLLSLLLITTLRGWAQEAIEPTAATPAATAEAPADTADEATPAPRHSKEKSSSEAHTARDVQDSMTAQEFKAAGLDKLSETELKNLNAWLQGYRQKAETKAAAVAVTEAKKRSNLLFNGEGVLSRIDNANFTGVTGHSIIKLEDGSVWKQANDQERYHAQVSNHPPVRVTRTSFGYKMHIVGVAADIYVDPVH